MPTTPISRYAHMTASQVLAEQVRLLDKWALEDAERRARNAAILATR